RVDAVEALVAQVRAVGRDMDGAAAAGLRLVVGLRPPVTRFHRRIGQHRIDQVGAGEDAEGRLGRDALTVDAQDPAVGRDLELLRRYGVGLVRRTGGR